MADLSVSSWPSKLRLQDCYCLLLFCLTFFCQKSNSHEENQDNYLLCKFCGSNAADVNYIITVSSVAALKSENQTFAGRRAVVQTLRNPSGIYFDVITVRKSNCVGVGEWTTDNSWFPGFAWKVCVCQPQKHFLGWLFEPVDSVYENQRRASEKGFYALITDHILTEQFSNSLLIVPKSYTS